MWACSRCRRRFRKVNQRLNGKRISHVALVRTLADLGAVVPFLREAFELAENDG
jgi:hypothetical protein